MINTQDVNNTVKEFKDTVGALKKIDNLYDKIEKQYADFRKAEAAIKGLTKDVSDTSIKLSNAARSVEKCTVEGTDKLTKACNTTAGYVKSECNSVVAAIKGESEKNLSKLDVIIKDFSEQIDICIANADEISASAISTFKAESKKSLNTLDTIKKDVSEQISTCIASTNEVMDSAVSAFKAESEMCVTALGTIKKDISAQINTCIANTNDVADSIQESTRRYTLRTQAVVEDLRIDQNRMASELRRNAENDTQVLKAELNSVNQSVKALAETLSAVSIAQSKTHKLLIIATSFAALASVLSLIRLFI